MQQGQSTLDQAIERQFTTPADVVRIVRASTVLATASGSAVVVLPTAGVEEPETYAVLDRTTMNARSCMVKMVTEIGHMVVVLPASASFARLQQAEIVVIRLVPLTMLSGEAATLSVGSVGAA